MCKRGPAFALWATARQPSLASHKDLNWLAESQLASAQQTPPVLTIKRKEAAPAGRPPGLQIPHSPRMVSVQGNSFGEMPCKQGAIGNGAMVATRFCIHCAETATAPARPYVTDHLHNKYTDNIVRVGLNYEFH
jgi:hypothetical protein